MLYIIMCGGKYAQWETPKQLVEINGEPIVARTIRLLRENGVENIAISSNNPIFKYFGVPLLNHKNGYEATATKIVSGYWCEAFYPTDEPTCYIFGDVVFSPEAIKTIVERETEDIDFFASAPPFAEEYPKRWAEPFALKVQNTQHLKSAINITKHYADQGLFQRKPIMWELWQVIEASPLNHIDFHNYIAINDYTCDVDEPGDAAEFERIIGKSAL